MKTPNGFKKFYCHGLFLGAFLTAIAACSMPPKRTISQEELRHARNIAFYIIEDDPEGILKVLNSEGEVVVRADYFETPVYLQIFATPEGISLRHFDRDEYDFDEE